LSCTLSAASSSAPGSGRKPKTSSGFPGMPSARAAASALHGTGTARLGAQMGVPAATVCGWLRRLRARSGRLLQEATSGFGGLVAVIETPEGRDPSPPGPTDRYWATRCWAASASPLRSPPLPEADPEARCRGIPCPGPARATYREHAGVIRRARPATASILPESTRPADPQEDRDARRPVGTRGVSGQHVQGAGSRLAQGQWPGSYA
jgi:hypothetical protein